MKGHLTVVKLNKHGGIVETMGYPYLSLRDNVVTIYCKIDDIDHLGETIYTGEIIHFIMDKKIEGKCLESLYFAFGKGFGSNFAYNYASYDLFKKGASEYLSSLNKYISV